MNTIDQSKRALHSLAFRWPFAGSAAGSALAFQLLYCLLNKTLHRTVQWERSIERYWQREREIEGERVEDTEPTQSFVRNTAAQSPLHQTGPDTLVKSGLLLFTNSKSNSNSEFRIAGAAGAIRGWLK